MNCRPFWLSKTITSFNLSSKRLSRRADSKSLSPRRLGKPSNCSTPPAENIRALATDINLGRDQVDGWEIARHAREIHPEFPVVYMSGESAQDWSSKGVPNSIMLSKPFAPAQLVTAISNLFNSGKPTA